MRPYARKNSPRPLAARCVLRYLKEYPELPMLKGVHLTLLIGPAVPVPAPKSVVDALTSVQVNSGGERGGFQLAFSVSKNSPLLTTMLPAGYFDPIITRVIIIRHPGGLPTCFIDGSIKQSAAPPRQRPRHNS